jgi:hypothetical protein
MKKVRWSARGPFGSVQFHKGTAGADVRAITSRYRRACDYEQVQTCVRLRAGADVRAITSTIVHLTQLRVTAARIFFKCGDVQNANPNLLRGGKFFNIKNRAMAMGCDSCVQSSVPLGLSRSLLWLVTNNSDVQKVPLCPVKLQLAVVARVPDVVHRLLRVDLKGKCLVRKELVGFQHRPAQALHAR